MEEKQCSICAMPTKYKFCWPCREKIMVGRCELCECKIEKNYKLCFPCRKKKYSQRCPNCNIEMTSQFKSCFKCWQKYKEENIDRFSFK